MLNSLENMATDSIRIVCDLVVKDIFQAIFAKMFGFEEHYNHNTCPYIKSDN